jgi:hypothetical protein
VEGILIYIGLKDIFILPQPNCEIQRYDNTGTDKSLCHFIPHCSIFHAKPLQLIKEMLAFVKYISNLIIHLVITFVEGVCLWMMSVVHHTML